MTGPVCGFCDRPRVMACGRCGTSLCRVHRPAQLTHCETCEGDYRSDRVRRIALHAAATVGVVTALLAALFVLALTTGGGLLALIPLVILSAVPGCLCILEQSARNRFLSETVARRLPSARIVESR